MAPQCLLDAAAEALQAPEVVSVAARAGVGCDGTAGATRSVLTVALTLRSPVAVQPTQSRLPIRKITFVYHNTAIAIATFSSGLVVGV